MQQTMGPLLLDLVGTDLTQEESELLNHPLIGGVIFFSRNYESPEQIAALTKKIRAACKKPLLLTVDQEGGRVQRFKSSFLRLPSMGDIGNTYEKSPALALNLANTVGYLMAAELLSVGIDLSFAPVLDLNKKINTVIGDRSFGSHPDRVIALAKELIQGMQKAGMAACGKHFPGHGSVTLDSHIAMPRDSRALDIVTASDMQPFISLIKTHLAAIMPAHIVFDAIDPHAVGFSHYWLQTLLRTHYHFSGVIISDDMNMEGASVAGNYLERVTRALQAGCDIILLCNNRKAIIHILDQLPHSYYLAPEKYLLLKGLYSYTHSDLLRSKEWTTKKSMLDQWIDQHIPHYN
jgi:beta-N-acetylhexosaminidase